jgi:hypothetical protein
MKVLLLVICCAVSAAPQQVAVSKQNKTITISADETMKFEPDIAKLEIGRQDYASTQDEAFRATKTAITHIIESLHNSGIQDQAISTESLTLEEQTSSDSARQVPINEKFHSSQRLQVIVSVSTAQAVLDSAVQAGANDVGNPEWLLKDYDLAQAKAAGAALKKARTNAEQMAAGLGAKLGDLVYASNAVPNVLFALRQGLTLNSQMVMVTSTAARREEALKLFPQPVEVKATVYATFAIE